MKKVVIGLEFGDEGKGLVTDWLSSIYDKATTRVVRFSGGHQAGHCVTTKSDKHIFSNFGSGTLRGLPTFWKAKTFDPVGFMNEWKSLKESYSPKITVDTLCPITTPYEKVLNAMRESQVKHGSVGVGFSDTIRREEAGVHLYFKDLEFKTVWDTKLAHLEAYWRTLGVIPSAEALEEFNWAVHSVLDIADSGVYSPADSSMEIWEGSQGLMLDRDYGFYPHMTYARLGTQEFDSLDSTEFFLVTRAYQTRHGNGPMTTPHEEPDNSLINNHNETNVTGDFQGSFRKGILDLDLLGYALTIDKGILQSMRKNLVITCMDQLKEYKLAIMGKVLTFNNASAYISYINNWLPNRSSFKHIYVSYGPTAEDIQQIY